MQKQHFNYIPPKETARRNQLRLFLPILPILLLVMVSGLWLFTPKNHKTPLISAHSYCQNDPFYQLDNSLVASELKVADYLFYGESLNLFDKNYHVGVKNGLAGKSIQLENICTGEIFTYLLNDNLDQNIPLGQIPTGLYRLLIQDNLGYQWLVSDLAINDSLTTITRNKQRYQVRLFNDHSLLKDKVASELLNVEKSLFLEVTVADIDRQVIDIMLDPAYNHQDFGPINRGYQTENFDASQATFRFMNDVKQKLETYGLTVALTRPNMELVVNTYGERGRVEQALQQEAKLMIEAYFESVSDSTLQGASLYGSYYASRTLQDMIVVELESNHCPIFIGSRYQKGSFYNPIHQESKLDRNNLIRESGAKALGASYYSEISSRLNQFAKDNRHGIHTISFNLLFTSNPQFETLWHQHYDSLVDSLVQGIINYLGISN